MAPEHVRAQPNEGKNMTCNKKSCKNCPQSHTSRGPWAATFSLSSAAEEVLGNGIERILELAGESTERVAESARQINDEMGRADSEFGLLSHFIRQPHGLDLVALKGGTIALDDPHRLAKTRAKAAIFSAGTGKPFQYSQQNEGLVYAPLRPKADAALNCNASSEEFLPHTDDAIIPQPYRCREIWLVGEHNVSGAATGFAQVDEIKSELGKGFV